MIVSACGDDPSPRMIAPRHRPVALQAPSVPPPAVALPEIQFDRATCIDRDSLAHFFPAGSLFPGEGSAKLDELFSSWYSRVLTTMAEPSLSCGRVDIETYRFLMIPTWGPPAAVRIAFGVRGALLTARLLSGLGGYDVGHLERSAQRVLFWAEREALLRAIERADFWRMRVRDPERLGVDGSQWILEGRSASRYHVVDRWSPHSGEFHELGTLFARLGGVPFQ